MDLQVEDIAGGEPEVLEDGIGFDGPGIVSSADGAAEQDDSDNEGRPHGDTSASGELGRGQYSKPTLPDDVTEVCRSTDA
jgi:hypothetical protein